MGKVGVAIDSLEDMERLFQGIKLEDVSTSMTINATGFILLALYVALAKSKEADLTKISGTIQNDILKEYAARGTYIYPPKPSMRIITDILNGAPKRYQKVEHDFYFQATISGKLEAQPSGNCIYIK